MLSRRLPMNVSTRMPSAPRAIGPVISLVIGRQPRPEGNPMVDRPEPQAPARPSQNHGSRVAWYRDWALASSLGLVLAADQLTKYFIRTNLRLGQSWPEDGIVRLTHGTNTGSVFGLFPNQTFLLIIASIVAILFLAYFYRAHASPTPMARFAIGLLLGGALGNLIDRVRAGTVVDFIDLGPWPIFNLADSSIVVGIILLIGTLLLSESKQASPRPGDQGPADDAPR